MCGHQPLQPLQICEGQSAQPSQICELSYTVRLSLPSGLQPIGGVCASLPGSRRIQDGVRFGRNRTVLHSSPKEPGPNRLGPSRYAKVRDRGDARGPDEAACRWGAGPWRLRACSRPRSTCCPRRRNRRSSPHRPASCTSCVISARPCSRRSRRSSHPIQPIVDCLEPPLSRCCCAVNCTRSAERMCPGAVRARAGERLGPGIRGGNLGNVDASLDPLGRPTAGLGRLLPAPGVSSSSARPAVPGSLGPGNRGYSRASSAWLRPLSRRGGVHR